MRGAGARTAQWAIAIVTLLGFVAPAAAQEQPPPPPPPVFPTAPATTSPPVTTAPRRVTQTTRAQSATTTAPTTAPAATTAPTTAATTTTLAPLDPVPADLPTETRTVTPTWLVVLTGASVVVNLGLLGAYLNRRLRPA
jgi:hypothetical protein